MQVKTFTGASDKDVLDQVKAELGTEAVIIESRKVKENGRTVVRMTAALERLEQETPVFGNGAGSVETGFNGLPVSWESEWQGIKSHLLALMKPALRLDSLDKRQRATFEYLEREGVSDQALLELYRRLTLAPKSPVLALLAEMLPVRPWGYESWPQRVHLVAGPFGAGKSTAAVRLALALRQDRHAPKGRVCIVNADAERGGGRLLLKHYTGLTDLGYREASNPMEMAGVLSEIQSQGFDRIIVDLPGLGREGSLKKTISSLGLDRTVNIKTALHLVMPTHYCDDTLLDLARRYMPGKDQDFAAGVIWSKLDEGGKYGSILNFALAAGLPVSALSFGPGLLNSLVPARHSQLWRLIFKHELPLMSPTDGPGFNSGDSYE